MPIVTIQITREGTTPGARSVTAEEKAALIKGASQLLLDVLKKPLEVHFRRHRRGRHGQLGLGRTARARVSQEARKGARGIRKLRIAFVAAQGQHADRQLGAVRMLLRSKERDYPV